MPCNSLRYHVNRPKPYAECLSSRSLSVTQVCFDKKTEVRITWSLLKSSCLELLAQLIRLQQLTGIC